MEVITVDRCPCCDGRNFVVHHTKSARVIRAFRDLSQSKYGGFMDGWENILTLRLAECVDCKHIWHHTHPDQDTLIDMYTHGGRMRRGPANTTPTPQMKAIMRGLAKSCDGLSLLDYGSGAGRWSSAAASAGFKVTAYEPATSRQGYVESVEVVSSLEELKGRRFDAINLEQVLEHVPDPIASLGKIRQYCHAGTLIRISVPDVTRYAKELWAEFPFNGQTTHILSPFEHLQGFCGKSFEALLQRAQLKPCANWKLLMSSPHYSLRKYAASLGMPFGRTTVLARFGQE